MKPPFATGEPFAADEIVAAIGRLHEEGERYLREIPPEEFVAPQGDRWSPADHARHLAKSTFPLARALSLPRLVIGLRFGRGDGRSRSFVELRETYRERLRVPGAGAGRFAPSPRPLPDDLAAWQREVLATWRAAIEALAVQASAWKEPALDRYRLPHPLLGKLTVREMLCFTLYHTAHHLELISARRSS